MHCPLVLVLFNRPQTTARVFAAIAEARPPKLLVVADGPRPDRPGEAAQCAAARAVVGRVDWDCEVLLNFAEQNLGLKQRMVSGLTWAFEQVPEAIILEDDCVPDPTFFQFCEVLLDRYRDDERVMALCGDNCLFGQVTTPYSYFFHRVIGVWGWATWRRAWQHYDVRMADWGALRDTPWLSDLLQDRRAAAAWRQLFDDTWKGNPHIWSYQWVFAIWRHNGVGVTPRLNLVSNVGFGAEAVHTNSPDSLLNSIPARALAFPLDDPPKLVTDREADWLIMENSFYAQNPWLGKPPSLRQRVRRVVPRPIRRLRTYVLNRVAGRAR